MSTTPQYTVIGAGGFAHSGHCHIGDNVYLGTQVTIRDIGLIANGDRMNRSVVQSLVKKQ